MKGYPAFKELRVLKINFIHFFVTIFNFDFCYKVSKIQTVNRRNKQSTPGLGVIILFSCSTQLRTKFILLINAKMPTIVGILTSVNMINTTSERLKARYFFICQHFRFYEQLKFRAQLS